MVIGNPFPLKQNEDKSFQGSILTGTGFILANEEVKSLLAKDPRYKDVLFPYLNGDDLNNDPEQKASRWVINFFDWSEQEAKTYSDCFDILEQRVKPERQRWKLDAKGSEIVGTYALGKSLREKWWIYEKKRTLMYETISKLDQGTRKHMDASEPKARYGKILARSLTSKHHSLTFANISNVIDQTCVVFCFNASFEFCILMSDIHFQWIVKASANLGGTGRYNISAGFETFPFPKDLTSSTISYLDLIGAKYYEHRQKLMSYMDLGLTKAYNLFHFKNLTLSVISRITKKREDEITEVNEGIVLWRDLHIQMNEAVKNAYGWSDIKLRHDFYEVDYLPEKDRVRFTIHPEARREILKRLLLLNHKLHDDEMTLKPIFSKMKGQMSQPNSLFSNE